MQTHFFLDLYLCTLISGTIVNGIWFLIQKFSCLLLIYGKVINSGILFKSTVVGIPVALVQMLLLTGPQLLLRFFLCL